MNTTTNAYSAAGGVLLIGLNILKMLAIIGVYLSVFVGVYLPLLGAIMGNLVSALWLVPLGMLIGALAFMIQSFILEAVFFLPMSAATWLAMRGQANN